MSNTTNKDGAGGEVTVPPPGGKVVGLMPEDSPGIKNTFWCEACDRHPGVKTPTKNKTMSTMQKHKFVGDIQDYEVFNKHVCHASLPLYRLMDSNKRDKKWFEDTFGPQPYNRDEVKAYGEINDPRYGIWPNHRFPGQPEDVEEEKKKRTEAKLDEMTKNAEDRAKEMGLVVCSREDAKAFEEWRKEKAAADENNKRPRDSDSDESGSDDEVEDDNEDEDNDISTKKGTKGTHTKKVKNKKTATEEVTIRRSTRDRRAPEIYE